MSDVVTRWAMIQSKLKEARNKALEQEGITESGLRELENQALAHIQDTIETEYGTVQKIPDKPIAYSIRRAENQETIFKKKLKLITHNKE